MLRPAFYQGPLDRLSKSSNQSAYIEKIEKHLQEGGDIDVYIKQSIEPGTILHHAIILGLTKLVKYLIDHGADVTKEMILIQDHQEDRIFLYRLWNCFEIAIIVNTEGMASKNRNGIIFNMLRDKCMVLYSQLGFHQIHIASAYGDMEKISEYLDPNTLDQYIDYESPFWAGMSPLLVSAKFGHHSNASRLLKKGAEPGFCDKYNNTALHYVSSNSYYFPYMYDLFIRNDDIEATFGSLHGMSHFHIACQYYPDTQEELLDFLKQGISPNLKVKAELYVGDYNYKEGDSALHAGRLTRDRKRYCPELGQILFEYGADVDQKDRFGQTPLQKCITRCATFNVDINMDIEFICLLIENGANTDIEHLDLFVSKITRPENVISRLSLLRCIKKVITIDKNLISENLTTEYKKLLLLSMDFNEIEFEALCVKELKVIEKHGLRHLLGKNNMVIKIGQFSRTVVESNNFSQLYPIYGRWIKIRLMNAVKEEEEAVKSKTESKTQNTSD